MFGSTMGDNILSIGKFIDHISGYLPSPGAYEYHNIYEWGNGPGATTVEIVNFFWSDPNTALIIYIIYDDESSTNEVWAGGYVGYRVFASNPPYTHIKGIMVVYGWYYGGGSQTPSVSYYGWCNCYGYDQS